MKAKHCGLIVQSILTRVSIFCSASIPNVMITISLCNTTLRAVYLLCISKATYVGTLQSSQHPAGSLSPWRSWPHSSSLSIMFRLVASVWVAYFQAWSVRRYNHLAKHGVHNFMMLWTFWACQKFAQSRHTLDVLCRCVTVTATQLLYSCGFLLHLRSWRCS